jgi:hypothetical protein
MMFGFYSSTMVKPDGSRTFTVTDHISTEVPPPPGSGYVSYCLTTRASLSRLSAGEYTVNWLVKDFGIDREEAGGTFRFQVSALPVPLFGIRALLMMTAALAAAGVVALRGA